MYCKRCGSENSEKNRYCWKCGQPLGGPGPRRNADNRRKRHPFSIAVALAMVLVIGVGVVALVLQLMEKNKEKRFEDAMADAGNYLETSDYTKAEDYYLKAIEIDEKQETPYLELADLYQKQKQTEKATEILRLGVERTDSQKIETKYKLYTYVDEVLIPEEGECGLGPFECRYYAQGGGRIVRQRVREEAGVLTSKISDFDRDGEEELLVVVLDNALVEETTNDQINGVKLQMYEAEQDDIVMSDECVMMEDVLGGGDTEDDWMFLKTVDSKTYICSSTNQLTCLTADGVGVSLKVVSYTGTEFGFVLASAGSANASDFYGMDHTSVVDGLRRTGGFETTIENIYSTNEWYIPSWETYDEILFSIYGKNANADFESETAEEARRKFYETRDPSWLGSMEVQIYLGQRSDQAELAEM